MSRFFDRYLVPAALSVLYALLVAAAVCPLLFPPHRGRH